MNWKKINKDKSIQPRTGKYGDWKEILKKEGYDQCVYCSIHDSRLGGPRNFTVEHYKPKSKFSSLENDIKNLYYACCICNSFKGDDWPNNEDSSFDIIGYPNPSKIDYSELFEKITENCKVKGKYAISKYIIIKLYLNRPQLLMDRRLNMLKIKEKKVNEKLMSQMNQLKILAQNGNSAAINFLVEIVIMINNVKTTIQNTYNTTPYTLTDIKREKNK
jgi:hypothetical protein